MEKNKLLPSRKKVLLNFSIMSIILLLCCILAVGGFNFYFKNEDYLHKIFVQDMIILAVWIGVNIIYLVVLLKYNFYELNNNCFIHHRFTKELVYNYNDIVYIDEEYTNKTKTLLFYTSKGEARYFILDKEEKLLQEVKKKCNNLMSKEDFRVRFSNKKMK